MLTGFHWPNLRLVENRGMNLNCSLGLIASRLGDSNENGMAL